MAESTKLVDLIQLRLDRFLDEQDVLLSGISPDLLPLVQYSRGLLAGGKRFRALFCYWGWRSAGGGAGAPETPETLAAIVDLAAGLELFHAAALIHDDIIDNSVTRRGNPSGYRFFADLHQENGWAGDSETYGRSSAILLGDLMLGWSDELVHSAFDKAGRSSDAARARREFTLMRTEVGAGQYLDLLDEKSWFTRSEDDLLDRAHTVVIYKSAKYSIQAPLLLGAMVAGADAAQIKTLTEFGLPLGVAFQLRDDLLGVFGDPARTGKPAGDDLVEGKRTVLIALARQRLSPGARRTIDELLGDPDLTPGQITILQSTLKVSGAVGELEEQIQSCIQDALTALNGSPLDPDSVRELRGLAASVNERHS